MFLVPKVMNWDLPRLRSKQFILNQSDMSLMSVSRLTSAESYDLDDVEIAASSAYKQMCDEVTEFTTSLVYKMKSRGPSTEPCGTPLRKVKRCEMSPACVTYRERLERYWSSRFTVCELIP